MDESQELNRLVRELNESRKVEAVDVAAAGRLEQWLRTLVARGGSDLLLVADAPPCVRVQGEVKKLEASPLHGAEIDAAVLPALAPHALGAYREGGIADSSYRIAGVGRFRINIHRERGRAAAAIRALPTRVRRRVQFRQQSPRAAALQRTSCGACPTRQGCRWASERPPV